MNVEKQVAHWLNSAKEDWEVANQLMQSGKVRHGLFFVHLTLEKVLKAVYTKRLAQVPPKLHDLVKLAAKCGLDVTEDQNKILARITTYNMEGRYAGEESTEVAVETAKSLLQSGEGMYQWLIKRL